jgi:polyisoprenoid-binding protein YceI
MQKRPLQKSLWVIAASSALFGISTAGQAALSAAGDTHVTFQAAGPAGMKIEGTTTDLTAAEQDGNLVITVPLANLSTGIGLRDKHMKEKYLETGKYPTAVLTVPRSALKVPPNGEQVEADAQGTLQLHGQSKPVSVHYQTKSDGGGLSARGSFHVNMKDFGIEVPSYLGVTVKPDVDVSASFRAAGS